MPRWILKFQMSSLELTQCLEYLGLIVGTDQFEVFFPLDKLLAISPGMPAIPFYLKALSPMVASFKKVLFLEFHSRSLQPNTLGQADSVSGSLYSPDQQNQICPVVVDFQSKAVIREVISPDVLDGSYNGWLPVILQ